MAATAVSEPVAATRAWVAAAWPDRAWAAARVRHGAFHDVMVAADCVARVARGEHHQARVSREAQLLQAAGQLGLHCAIPSLLGGPVSRADRSAVLTTLVGGVQRASARWTEVRSGLLAILDELGSVPAKDATTLPAARMWCGGAGWRCARRLRVAQRAVAIGRVLRLDRLRPPWPR
jgi:hypothetical protein